MALRKRVLSGAARAAGRDAARPLVTRLPLAPDINMEGIRIRGHHGPQDDATPDRRRLRRGRLLPRWWACRSWRAAPITEDDVEGRAQGRGGQRDDGAPLLARAERRRRAPLHRRLRGGAARGGGRRARPQGALGGRGAASVPPLPRPPLARDLAGRAHDHPAGQGAARCCARRSSRSSPTIVFTEDVPATDGRGHHDRAHADRRGAARRVRRPGAAAGRGRPLRRDRVLGEHAHARDGRAHGAGRASRATCCGWCCGRAGGSRSSGIGAGAVLAALVGRVLGSLLYGVSALDPIAYAVAAAVLLAVAAVAAFVPALARGARRSAARAADGVGARRRSARRRLSARRCARAASKPSTVDGWATARTVRPAARAASAVVGPMTAAGTARPSAPAERGEGLDRGGRGEDGGVHSGPQALRERLSPLSRRRSR